MYPTIFWIIVIFFGTDNRIERKLIYYNSRRIANSVIGNLLKEFKEVSIDGSD